QNVGAPGRANCGSCHFFGGGGDAVKHGDLDSTLTNPNRELDVHMGTDSLDFTCTTCHGGEDHEIAGRIYSGEARVLCEDCHAGDEAPHQDSELRTALTQHTENVACQTCHIPAFARGQATKMSWDWSTAGAKNDEGNPYIQKDAEGQVVYDSMKGTFTNGIDVIPDYRWWNGNVTYLTIEDTIDAGQVVKIADTEGSRGDGKITPFKRFTGVQPYDAGHNTMVVPNLFPNDAGDTAAYWRSWDWQAAVASGMATAGADYSGELGWVQTEMLWAQNHMVAPSDQALGCTDCHVSKGRLDFEALGYEPQRAAFLSSLAEPDAPSGAPHTNLTQYAGPETCLTCHRDAGREVAESMHYSWLGVAQNVEGSDGELIGMGTEYGALPASVSGINWLGVLQPQDDGKPPVAGGCAQCHVGFGDKPNPPDALTEADYRNVDCLICHGQDYARTVVQDNGEIKLVPADGIDILEVVRNVQRSTNEACLACHLSAGGDPNFKHGVSSASPDVDVHVAAGLQCVDCHQVEKHRFGGSADLKGVDRPDLALDCTDCHDEQHATGFTAIDVHMERVACQTCHIPAIARDADYPTLVTKDWTKAVLQDNGLYAPAARLANNVTPIYRWWNGQVQSYSPGPVGSIDDATAKLTPWNYVESIVPTDAASGDFLPITTGVFAVTGDLDAAVIKGVEDSGVAYSGDWQPATTELLFSLNHQVAPASEALHCADCHTRDQGRLDFVALGYSEDQAADLVRADGAQGSAQGSAAPTYGTTAAEYSPEARAYAGNLADRLQEGRDDLGLWFGIIGGLVIALLLAVVLAVLILRKRDVTRQDARDWVRGHRRGVTGTVVLLVGTALIGFVSLHYLFEFTASTEFCGELCHATRAEYVTYHTSLHANVACTECHVGPGLDQELKAKLNGLRELFLYTTDTYERPIPSPVETLRPARNVCEQCHWPEVLYADRAVE
ncbi:MAG: tetrathionate reductase family octaheme c-type cytochrome, partial [Anaerolineae bacterium]|nr:tetrathionate reductase family octaheme c-type cytochrome [Anaerolineae bacterium]